MKNNVKSIIKNGFLALGLIFAINSMANPVTLSTTEELGLRLAGIGLTTIIAKTQKASNEFINSFLYLSGLFFTNKAVRRIPNVSSNMIDSTIDATGHAYLLPPVKQLLDILKIGPRGDQTQVEKSIISLGRYVIAAVASILAQEAIVGGYGVLKTLISNQITTKA